MAVSSFCACSRGSMAGIGTCAGIKPGVMTIGRFAASSSAGTGTRTAGGGAGAGSVEAGEIASGGGELFGAGAEPGVGDVVLRGGAGCLRGWGYCCVLFPEMFAFCGFGG